MTFSIAYTLRKSGWADCTVTLNGNSINISASYLSDALGNLVLAAGMTYSGFHAVSFGFDEEPGEYRWVIDRLDGLRMNLQVLEFEELWGNAPNEKGTVLLEGQMDIKEFAEEVERAATTVLQQHGENGYLEKWVEHPFPTHQLAFLNQLVERYR